MIIEKESILLKIEAARWSFGRDFVSIDRLLKKIWCVIGKIYNIINGLCVYIYTYNNMLDISMPYMNYIKD